MTCWIDLIKGIDSLLDISFAVDWVIECRASPKLVLKLESTVTVVWHILCEQRHPLKLSKNAWCFLEVALCSDIVSVCSVCVPIVCSNSVVVCPIFSWHKGAALSDNSRLFDRIVSVLSLIWLKYGSLPIVSTWAPILPKNALQWSIWTVIGTSRVC